MGGDYFGLGFFFFNLRSLAFLRGTVLEFFSSHDHVFKNKFESISVMFNEILTND